MKQYPELQCPICKHIPDDEDMRRDYHLSTCCKCGIQACDLCCFISGEKIEELTELYGYGNKEWKKHLVCAKCLGIEHSPGKDRKEIQSWEMDEIYY